MLGRETPAGLKSLLRQCCDIGSLRRVHDKVVSSGYGGDEYLGKLLVHKYGKHGDLRAARAIFDGFNAKKRDTVMWNTMVCAYDGNGEPREALRLFFSMDCSPDIISFMTVLRICTSLRALAEGVQIHEKVESSPLRDQVKLQNSIINMYSKCGSLEAARRVFDSMSGRDIVSWNSVLAAYAQNGHSAEVRLLYRSMQLDGLVPDNVTFVSLLRSCRSLQDVKSTHGRILSSDDVFVNNALVSGYARSGSLNLARQVFDQMQQRDLVSWNSMITAYVHFGHSEDAVSLYQQMDCQPDGITYASLFGACSQLGDIELGMKVESMVEQSSHRSCTKVQSALVHMYCTLGLLEAGKKAFDTIQGENRKNVSPWNAVIGGYAGKGQVEQAFDLLLAMQAEGVRADRVTFTSLLSGCLQLGSSLLEKIENQIASFGLHEDEMVQTSLMGVYSRSNRLEDALRVFRRMPVKSLVAWNAMLAVHVQSDNLVRVREAYCSYAEMNLEGVKADNITFVHLVGACSKLGDLKKGLEIRSRFSSSGCTADVILDTAILTMYAKCQDLASASEHFKKMKDRTIVTWNALIAAYTLDGKWLEALHMFEELTLEGLRPNMHTYVIVLSACSVKSTLHKGQIVHGCIIESGLTGLEASLINMYAKCGQLGLAKCMFEGMECRSLASYNAMLTAYSQHGLGKEALELYEKMEEKDSGTFMAALTACLSHGGLKKVREVHQTLHASGLLGLEDVVLETCLLTMYVKCGNLEVAMDLFDNMKARNSVCWNVIIGSQVQGHEALRLFRHAANEGVFSQHDETCHLPLLVACSHSGCLDEALASFLAMVSEWGVTPSCEHYRCMVDALARSGRVQDAQELMTSMPFLPDGPSGRAFIGSCRVQGEIELAAAACGMVGSTDSASYVLMSNTRT